jgi:hypothetical protein
VRQASRCFNDDIGNLTDYVFGFDSLALAISASADAKNELSPSPLVFLLLLLLLLVLFSKLRTFGRSSIRAVASCSHAGIVVKHLPMRLFANDIQHFVVKVQHLNNSTEP